MTTYVRAIYDFSGEPGSSEISITVGDILTLTRTDVGEGWWEGKTSQGRVGLFPAAYVETVPAAEVARGSEQPPTTALRYDQTPDMNDVNDGDSDWDDDWDNDSTYAKVGQPKGDAYDNKHLPVAPSEDSVSMTSSAAPGVASNATTLKKTSMFGKSSDSYILGLASRDKLPETEIVHIVQVDNFYYWQANHQAYTVVVASPKKESKFKGMKTFIAYQLTPSFNNISVSRRYKHFDWLHERLEAKFCLIPIPPLPDKQISGRYEEQFVEHRRVQLQEFVDWVCRHPVLSRCEVWYHFLTCTDDKIWKAGKRKAERDPYVGVTYCLAISPPEKHLLQSQVDGQMESCSLFVHAMDSSVKNLLAISNEAAKRNQLQCKKEFQRIGDGFADLAKALIIDEQRAPTTTKPLSTSVARIGAVFIDIGKIYGDQAKSDWTTLSDRLHIYRGVLNSFPSILSTHKDAVQQRKECERIAGERGNNVQMVDVNRRTDVVSYAVMAEMSHFKQERDGHMRQSLKAFVEEQIKFYQNVVAKLQEALVDIP